MLVPVIRGPSHLFYDRLNAQLDEHGFDEVEKHHRCQSAAPRRYFNGLLTPTLAPAALRACRSQRRGSRAVKDDAVANDPDVVGGGTPDAI